MTYEIWSTDSNNLVDWFETKAEIQAALREMTDLSGLVVGRRGRHGQDKWWPALDFAVIVGSHPGGRPPWPGLSGL